MREARVLWIGRWVCLWQGESRGGGGDSGVVALPAAIGPDEVSAAQAAAVQALREIGWSVEPDEVHRAEIRTRTELIDLD